MVFSFFYTALILIWFSTKCHILVTLYLTMQDVSMYSSLTIQYWSYRSFHTSARFLILAFCARIDRPSFRENKPKTLVFSHRKLTFWACFRENWVYKFEHWRRCFFGVLQFFINPREQVFYNYARNNDKDTHTLH
jgi:hypothetical protein